MLKLDMHPKVLKFVKELPPKQFKQVTSAIFDLTENPLANDVILVKGYQGIKRKDVGEYRIVFEHDNVLLFVWVIDKRNDDAVYKSLRQLLKG